jgi:hypothetical protein
MYLKVHHRPWRSLIGAQEHDYSPVLKSNATQNIIVGIIRIFACHIVLKNTIYLEILEKMMNMCVSLGIILLAIAIKLSETI